MPRRVNHETKKDLAIRALLEYPTIQEAAEAAGIPLRTFYRYLKDEEFKKQYKEARRQIMAATIGRLQSAAGTALTELMKIIESDQVKPYVKVQACRTVLEMAFKATELEELAEIEERVTELERQAEAGLTA